MEIAVIGTGTTGLVTALSLNEMGYAVKCVDNNHSKIKQLKSGECFLVEPGLNTLLAKHFRGNLISFFSDLDSLESSDLIFICTGAADDSFFETIRLLSESRQKACQIVVRTTVPPGTNKILKEKFKNTQLTFISNPHFLRNGSALKDNLRPDRIVIGAGSAEEAKNLIQLYRHFDLTQEQILLMDPTSAELTKYAANVMLAARVSLMSEFSQICEQIGADVDQIKKGVGADKRIGSQFLNPGIGYGSRLCQDLSFLESFAEQNGLDLKVTHAVHKANETQTQRFIEKISNYIHHTEARKLTIWGASFKPNTDDLRESPALKIISELMKKTSVHLQIYDLICHPELERRFHSNLFVSLYKNKYEALEDSDGLIICTEWPEFSEVDLKKVKTTLKKPKIFDGRNIYCPQQMRQNGFDYESVGRPYGRELL